MSSSAGSAEMDARDPLIVTGFLRSGVRLMGSLLDAHADLASGPDLPILVTMAMQWKEIATRLGENHAKHHALDADTVRNAFRHAAYEIVEPRLKAAGKSRFVIQSFAAMPSLESLTGLFPAARVILMVRDPRAVAQSLLRCDWRNPQDGRPLPYTRDVSLGGRLWVEFMRASLPNFSSLESAGRLKVIRYEDLCSAPEDTLAAIGAFIGSTAPPDEIRQSSAAFVTSSPDNPHPSLRAGSLDAASISSWKQAMPEQVAKAIRAAASPIAERFGY